MGRNRGPALTDRHGSQPRDKPGQADLQREQAGARAGGFRRGTRACHQWRSTGVLRRGRDTSCRTGRRHPVHDSVRLQGAALDWHMGDPALSAQRLGSREFDPINIGYVEDSSAGGVGPNVD
jgi:hypothetical protein